MTPEEFSATVLPRIRDSWVKRCLCESPGFWKLLSYDFRDHQSGPQALEDSEIVGYEIVRKQFKMLAKEDSGVEDDVTSYQCPQCGVRCTSHWEQFSINFDRMYYRVSPGQEVADIGLYLVGFWGFPPIQPPPDFRLAENVDQFLAYLLDRSTGHADH